MASLVLMAISLYSLMTKRFQFWPPPSKQSWQYRTLWGLFRVFVVGVIVVSVLDYNSISGQADWLRWVGLAVAVAGFFAASYISLRLGWQQAHGEAQALKTDGIFRWSRNPIYVVTFPALIGTALFVNSLLVYVLAALWISFYVVAIFMEEPWMEAMYGDAYVAYKSQVARFVGFGRKPYPQK